MNCKMKEYYFILSVVLLVVVASCGQQAQEVQQVPAIESAEIHPAEIPVNEQEIESQQPQEVTLPIEEVSAVHNVQSQETVETPEIVEIDITAKKFQFTPSAITVRQGQKVKLNIRSLDVTHGFSLPDYNILERIVPGKPVTVEFVADKKGTFTFFCSVYCGSGHGAMKGQLIIE